jgi:hypothetical protein
MEATILAESDQLPSLLTWLRQEHIDGMTVEKAIGTPRKGEMGIDLAALNLVLSAPAVATLAASVTVWLKTRRSKVTIRIKSADKEIEIDSTNVDHADEVIRNALKADPDPINT